LELLHKKEDLELYKSEGNNKKPETKDKKNQKVGREG
jgi:hypothetical protein